MRSSNPFTDIPGSDSQTRPLAMRRGLAWEEAAVDSGSDVEGFSEQHQAGPLPWWLGASVLCACIILVGRLFHLQVVQGQQLQALAEGNRLRVQTIIAPRGFIKDRFGTILARNTASYSLTMVPADVPAETDKRADLISQMAAKFALDTKDVTTVLAKASPRSLVPIVLKRNIAPTDAIWFETVATQFPGFTVAAVPVRDYPDSMMLSHVLGYTGVISDSELSRVGSTYDPQDFIGKSGVELQYESYLRGLNGSRQVEVDAAGRVVKLLGDVEPEPGNIVQLNLDMELQKVLYEQFQKAGPRVKGAAVALDPQTGQVLALVSIPGFNSNLFAPGITAADYQQLLTDPNLPLFNRAIAGTYPPGSVIKPVGAVAGLEEGSITSDTVIYDRGTLTIPNQYDPSISYQFRGWKPGGLGAMTVRSAIAESSDIFYYVLSGGHPSSSVVGLGAEKLASYYRKFAMGQLTGIDLDGEKPGRVADPTWKATRYASDPISAKWYLGDTYHISIGQGDMLATPLQVAVWTAAVANGGTVYKPQVVHSVIGQNGQVLLENKPTVLIQNSFKPETMHVVQEGMRENVASNSGSGRSLQSLPIPAAGKTGTSQFDGSDPSRTHAWYTAYAPYDHPQITIAVLVEAGGEGHAVAVPVVREALRWWAEHRYNK